MKMPIITLNGLLSYDDTILDSLTLPADLSSLRDAIIGEIIYECGYLETTDPDPDNMKAALIRFSAKNALRWQKLYNTTQFTYNPIWNKDGTVTETENRALTNTAKTATSGTGSNTHGVAGYNTDTVATDNVDNSSSTGAMTGSGTEDEDITRNRTEQGNIGVTTTQQMIKEEREVWDFTIVDAIVHDFKKRFCVLIY